jgi:hypothetical protein
MLINDAESEEPGKDSAEVQGSTYVIDGIPMSFAEMVAYREAKEERARKATQAMMEQQAEEQAAYDAKDKWDALHADDYTSNAVLATTDI